MPASLSGAAGEIISNLGDMQVLIKTWYEGKFFTGPPTLEMLKKDHYNDMSPERIIRYGPGCVNFMNKSLGHGGQTFGFTRYMGVTRDNFCFALGSDDASVSSWTPAMKIVSAIAGN